jgi:hypothetical protein
MEYLPVEWMDLNCGIHIEVLIILLCKMMGITKMGIKKPQPKLWF